MRLHAPVVLFSLLLACSGDESAKAPRVGPADCDPAAQTGCDDGQKCAWIELGDLDGAVGCVPEGSRGESQSCAYGAPGEQTGYDDCAAGLACLPGTGGATCTRLCDATTGTGCGTASACQGLAGMLEGTGAGVCTPSCDPVTQVRLTDDAPACGSPDPSAPALGCYGELATATQASAFFCAPAGAATLVHRVAARTASGGGAYLNGCAPGYLPLLVDTTGSSTVVCIATCAPLETHADDTSGIDGAAPHSCAARGATAPGEECRFLSWLEPEDAPVSASNGMGLCFDPTKYTWDHDRNEATAPVPMPSCAELPDTDTDADGVPEHAEWGCAPRPES